MKETKDFFISYTGVDKNWAEWIAWQLEDAGFRVVIQAWDFRPGGNFVLDMQKAAEESERIVAVLSPDFLDSKYTKPEWAVAFAQDPTGEKGLLVPIRVRECKLSGLLSQIVYIDFVGLGEKAAIDALLKGIERDREAIKPSSSPQFPGVIETRSYPRLPPFPSESQEQVIQPEPVEGMTEYLPHPIAAAFSAFQEISDKREKFVALDDLLKNTVNYLAAVALSQYRQDSPDKEKLRLWLRSLAGSLLLPSLRTLNQVEDEYQALEQKPYLYPALFERYEMPVAEDSPIGQAYRILAGLDKTGQKTNQITPRVFLERLLVYRQSHWEKDRYKVDKKLRDKILPVLDPAIVHLLTLFTNFFRYGLRYIERVDRDGEDWIYTMVEFPGPEGHPTIVPIPFREYAKDEPTYKPQRLYLCSAQNQPLVNLHPLLISHLYKLFFLEFIGEEESIWYSHCCSPERFKAQDYYPSIYTIFNDDEIPTDDDWVKNLKKVDDEMVEEEAIKRIEKMPFPILLAHLSDSAREALEIGLGESLRIGQFWLGVEFLLMGLSKLESGSLVDLCTTLGIHPGYLRGKLRVLVDIREEDWRQLRDVKTLGAEALPDLSIVNAKLLSEEYDPEGMPPIITPRLLAVLRQAVQWAGSDKVGDNHLLLATLQYHRTPAVNHLLWIISKNGMDPRQFLKELQWQVEAGKRAGEPGAEPVDLPEDVILPQPKPKQRGLLAQLGRDLTTLARAGDLSAAIGENAQNAIRQIGQILLQSQANNPILLGDSGVGKTAIVEGFAHRLATEAGIVPQLANRTIVDLPPVALLAGTKYRGELEERLQTLLEEIRRAQGQMVVFVDEIHTILGGGSEGGLGSISETLKPALARGEFPCIGATTVAEYHRYIEKDAALARRFTPIWLEEPSPKEAIEIAWQVAQGRLAAHHGVEYSPEAVQEAVYLSVRYLHDERLPGKVIKLLDQAGPRVVLQTPGALPGALGFSLRGAQDQELPVGSNVVTPEIIRSIVSERTRIPVSSLSESDKTKIRHLAEKLKARVMGQDQAVTAVAQVIKRARAGFSDPRRPLGVFLFAGPTGVGKTELALALAENLFDDEQALLRIDMSEYMEKHTVARLMGAPPGYVGYEDDGQLTGFLRRRPYSVVLFDEVEKAHPDVQHLFLQLFDAGRLTDTHGRFADGRNAIFIMTTNLGATEALAKLDRSASEESPSEAGEASQETSSEPEISRSYSETLMAAIAGHFSAEFLNRLDNVLLFDPLTAEALENIFEKLFTRASQRLADKGVQVEMTPAFKQAFCNAHTSTSQGARPLERAIDNEIIELVVDRLLEGAITQPEQLAPGLMLRPLSKRKQSAKDISSQGSAPQPVPIGQAPNDDRDSTIEQNKAQFDMAWQALLASMKSMKLKIEITPEAIDFLCDPLWNEKRSLEQALLDLVEKPLQEKVNAGDFQPGDRVRIKKYGPDLEFELEGER